MKTDFRNTLDGLLAKYPTDLGLLILRIGIGGMFISHGLPKIMGGQEMWTGIGGALGLFGITFASAFWGLLASLAEFVGGIFIIFGFAFRPAALFLLGNMIVASGMHLMSGDGFGVASHAIEAGILFFSFLFIGPGEFSIDKRLAHVLFECKEPKLFGFLRHLYVTCGTK